MRDIKNWTKYEELIFEGEEFQTIDLTTINALSNSDNLDFDTKLTFVNCRIKLFNASTRIIGKHIRFENCNLGGFLCHATYFLRGLSIIDCEFESMVTFDCGVHNKSPYEFVIDNSTFKEYVDFFDVYFCGPIKIRNNSFKEGTNISEYIKTPYGFKKGISFIIENNKGKLDKIELL